MGPTVYIQGKMRVLGGSDIIIGWMVIQIKKGNIVRHALKSTLMLDGEKHQWWPPSGVKLPISWPT
jgi:hypothetical protein